MNLGHGRVGHLPDYSFARYRYLPAWANYAEITKDNPADYINAFCQMVLALRYLRGDIPSFETEVYDTETVAPYRDEIEEILNRRQLSASEEWKALGERLSGCDIEEFNIRRYQKDYLDAPQEEKENTFLGKFIEGALAQKSMVTNSIFRSGNRLAGISKEVTDHD